MITQPPDRICEFGGTYGPLVITERLVQQIWATRVADRRDLRTWAGEPVTILHRGRWNTLGGPDFIGAQVEIGGQSQVGDIEIHFYPEDWNSHGHRLNPEYNRVVLHVCVFPPKGIGLDVQTENGRQPALLVVGPYLPADLESLVSLDPASDGPASSTNPARPTLPEWDDPAEGRAALWAAARERFAAKVRAARWHIDHSGWEQACHEALLGQLGIPRNRAVMLSLAMAYPYATVCRDGLDPTDALDRFSARWKRSGMRPGSQPLVRLRQYAALVHAQPGWPQALAAIDAGDWYEQGGDPENTTRVRREGRFTRVATALRDSVWMGNWNGSRFDTLVVDVALPYWAALHGRDDAYQPWAAWPAGDWPDTFFHYWRDRPQLLAGTPTRRCNGLMQALLEWCLRLEYA
jgi:hypothetical protein